MERVTDGLPPPGAEPGAPHGRGHRSEGRRWRAGIVAGGLAVGLTLAGLGVAAAQTEDPGTTTAPPEQDQAPGRNRGGPGGPGGKGGHGPGMRGIHGEFTARAPGGGYQTLATQLGEVTAVSESSITVKSEDGFSRDYSVDDNTLVNAGNTGITDVKQGDEVRIMAVVKDGKAAAVDVRDLTQVRQLHEKWAPPRPEPPEGD